MKISVKNILTKAILILMTFFVGLPCTVKREIKQGLNFPISWNNTDKPINPIACQTYIQNPSVKKAISFQIKELKVENYFFQFNSSENYSWQKISLPDSPNNQVPIPIYILLGQYLI